MSRRGVVHIPNRIAERLETAINTFPGEDFTAADLTASTGLRQESVGTMLSFKLRQGVLERVARGRYRRIRGLRFAKRKPLSVIAEAVFTVFFTDPDRRPMRLAQVVGEVESYLSIQESCYGAVTQVLCIWARDGVLTRTGRFHEYAYALRTDVTSRPVCSAHAVTS